MAVIRQANLLGQQRIDVPHLRALESGVASDFDLLAGQILAGRNPLVVQGFALTPLAPGTAATSLQLNVANGVILHPQASESGSIFQVASGRTTETLNAANARVSGGFTASAVNYIGLDLRRTADSSTADLVQFLDPNSLLEKPKQVPLARTLDYVVMISTADFSTLPSVAPLAKVTTDANNNIVSIQDARGFVTRLGTGGTVPDARHAYQWPGGRTEVGDNSDFSAGDKGILSLKDWFDAAMTRLWELGGGEYWYSATADRNVVMARAGSTVFTNGEYFEWTGTNLHWRGLKFVFDSSTGWFNDVADQLADSAGQTDLADGQCVYVDLDRTTNRTGGTALVPVKATLTTLGTPTVPGSRQIVAWRLGTLIWTREGQFPVGTTFTPATTTALGLVKLLTAPNSAPAPVVPTADTANSFVVAAGISRSGTGGSIGAGAVTVGGGTNDSSVTIGKAATNTTVLGTLKADTLDKNAGTLITSNTGIAATASAANGTGLSGTGTGNGTGVSGTGTGSGSGVVGVGGATGSGGVFTSGGGAANALVGDATAGTGIGVAGVSPTIGVRGNGTTNGIGVQGNGAGTGQGGDFTGGATGPGIVSHAVALNDQPSYLAKDEGGNNRWLIDHNGYPMSRLSTFREEWIQGTAGGGTGVPAWWQQTGVTTPGTLATAGGGTNTNPWSTFTVPTTNNANATTWATLFTTGITYDSDNSVIVMEWDAASSNVADGATWGMGLCDNANPVFSAATFGFQFLGASGNWLAKVGTAAAVSTGVSNAVNGTWFRFRLEWHGKNTPIGIANIEGVAANTAKIRFFVNDVRRTTQSGGTLTQNVVRPFFSGTNPGAGFSANSISVGPVVITWNRYLSNPAL